MGNIRTKARCPECAEKFVFLTKTGKARNNTLGLVCPNHINIRPTSYYLDLGRSWDKVYCDRHGRPLTSFPQALEVQKEIDALIMAKKYRPERYKQRGVALRTIAGLMPDFFDDREIAPSYEADYWRHLTEAADFFGDDEVNTLDDIDMKRYVKHLRTMHPLPVEKEKEKDDKGETVDKDKKPTLTPWKEKTLKNYVDSFETFMRWAAKDLKFAMPTFPKITVPKLETPEWIVREEQEKLAEEGGEPFLDYLFFYGHRPCMARALLVRDVNLVALTITVNLRRFSRNTLVSGPAKKGKVGTLPIMPDEHPRLAKYIFERCNNAHPEAFLFPDPRNGKPYTQDAAGRLWRSVRKRLNIKESVKLRHVTRHSVASILLNQGYSFEEIGELLCVSPEMLRRHYAHHDVNRKRSILESMKDTRIGHVSNIINLNVAPTSPQKGKGVV